MEWGDKILLYFGPNWEQRLLRCTCGSWLSYTPSHYTVRAAGHPPNKKEKKLKWSSKESLKRNGNMKSETSDECN